MRDLNRYASGPRARTRSGEVSADPPPIYDVKKRWVRPVREGAQIGRLSSRLGDGAKAPFAKRRRC